MKNLYLVTAALLVLNAASFATTLTITTPSNGATVSTSMRVTASTDNGTSMRAYVDNNLLYKVQARQLDTTLNVSAGQHHLVVVTWDASGKSYTADRYVTAQSTTPPTPSSGITVNSPSNGATVSSPVQFSATAANGTAMHIYVDNQLAYQVNASSLNTSLAMSSGAHYVVVQAWDQSGNVTKSPLNITVSGGSPGSGGGPSIPSNATVYKNIDQMANWDSCSACAGDGGAGPVVPYSYTQGRSSPSIDGSSMQFWLGGSTPWGAALWWKQLTPLDSAKHYVYDLYFYYQDKYAPQSLEFDMNVTANGKRYIFGTQCDIGASQGWDTWNNPGHYWDHTGVACPAPPVNTWNHLIWEFQRNDDGSMTFLALTLNGNRKALNITTWPTSQDGQELNVAFQMDGNYQEANYSVWLDKVQLSAW